MKIHDSYYRSYLIRFWKEHAESDWRASIQDIGSGECKYFARLSELLQFLEQALDNAPPERSKSPAGPPRAEI
jgi:hypothetical protein